MSEDLETLVSVTHVPLDGPGIRIARPGDAAAHDVNLTYLRSILESSEENLALTEAALAEPATRDLAQAVRAALLNLDNIAFHLLELHQGLHDGRVNYPADPISGYPGS